MKTAGDKQKIYSDIMATSSSPMPSPPTMSRGGSLNGRRTRQTANSGCEVPFVLAGGSFTRFKQLSTRRSHQPQVAPAAPVTTTAASSPSLVGIVTSSVTGANIPAGQNKHSSSSTGSRPYYLYTPMDKSEFAVKDEAEDHPMRRSRKETGFLQPIKHLSGRVVKLSMI